MESIEALARALITPVSSETMNRQKPRVRRASADRPVGPIKSKARREQIERLIERTTKDKGLSPEVVASLHDDAWGKPPSS